MKVIPAVDIMGGRCVQLVGGDPETRENYGDPVENALNWQKKGAEILHVVDLDAALGLGKNLDSVLKIKRHLDIPVEFGGGIRDIDGIREVLRLGIDKAIIGTLAVRDYTEGFPTIQEINDEFGEQKVIIAVDSKDGFVTVKGWQERTSLTATRLIQESEQHACGFLYTDVTVEGKMQGVQLDRIREVVEATEKPVIISGGVTTKDDLEKISDTGAWGVVVGKALYEGILDFEGVI